jgi:hypothetical protein
MRRPPLRALQQTSREASQETAREPSFIPLQSRYETALERIPLTQPPAISFRTDTRLSRVFRTHHLQPHHPPAARENAAGSFAEVSFRSKMCGL